MDQVSVAGRTAIDAYLAIISVRVVREYSDKSISDESLRRVLEAGRATGSSQNRQAWKFYVVRDRARLAELAETVYAPGNIKGSQVAIALTTTARNQFDAGRCLQNMVIAAWADGIGSAPNGVRQVEAATHLLGVPPAEELAAILSLGYPLHPHTPSADDVDGILRRIKRKPPDELVVWVD